MDSTMAAYGTGGMPFGMAGGAGKSSQALPAEFLLSEEYEVPSSGANPTAMMAGSEGMSSPVADSSTNTESDEYRYIARESAYRTRGFKLRLAVHQMRVAEVLRELMNSRYPIEITRFQFSAMNPDEPSGSRNSAFSSSPAMAASSGYSIDTTAPGAFETNFAPPTDSTTTFDPGAFAAGGESFSSTPMSSGMTGNSAVSLVAQAALKEVDLVELVIVGEFYLYNPVEEVAVPVDGAPSSGGSATTESLANSAAVAQPDSALSGESSPPAGSTEPPASTAASEAPAAGSNTSATLPMPSAPGDVKPAGTPAPAPAQGSAPATTPMPDGNAATASPAPPSAAAGSM